MTVEFDSSPTLTGTCSGSVWPCGWLGLAGPFGPESGHVDVRGSIHGVRGDGRREVPHDEELEADIVDCLMPGVEDL